MNERILKWLFDIQDAIQEIEGYFIELPSDINLKQAGMTINLEHPKSHSHEGECHSHEEEEEEANAEANKNFKLF